VFGWKLKTKFQVRYVQKNIHFILFRRSGACPLKGLSANAICGKTVFDVDCETQYTAWAEFLDGTADGTFSYHWASEC
jgi:hypothetical protein